ncbi:MAG TPA: tetratricopeptide repeat protein [Polyangiales bacterium]|nr:tetratricopeptide repeat protein [Polyangiales bacterium]
MRPHAWLSEVCWLVLLLGVVAACAFHPLYAVDFFWHLKLGQVIADSGSIPRTNLFSSAAPERGYVQFNWLWDLAAAQVVRAFGLHGVRVLQTLLMAASFAGLYALARRLTPRRELACLVSALGLVWFEDRFQERPAALVLAFVIALAPFLLGGHRERSAGWLAAGCALIGVLWSNLHGGESLLLPLSFGALLVGEALRRRKREARRALLGLGVSCAALLVSPTFVAGMRSWIGTIGAQVEAGNEEWQPAYSMLAHGLRPSYVIIALGPTVVLLVWGFSQWRRYRREGKAALDPAEILLCLGYLALAHQAVRNVFLSLLPLLFMLQRTAAEPSRPRRALLAAAAVALLAISAEDALLYSYGSAERVAQVMRYDLAPDAFPELASDFAREAGLEGGMVNDGRWGGYLIWRLWPSIGVFADTRHHFTPDMWKIFRQTHDALQRPLGLSTAFASYGTELAMFRGPTFPLGTPPNYRLLYKAGDQELFQDLRGRHAHQNLERTRRWLERQGVRVPEDPSAPEIPELARKLGAERYLASPYPQLEAADARRQIQDASAAVRCKGHQTLAGLAYRAGDHAAAAVEFEGALRERPDDAVLRYQAAQNSFAGGDYARARAMLQVVVHERLSERQLRRAQAMLALSTDRSR